MIDKCRTNFNIRVRVSGVEGWMDVETLFLFWERNRTTSTFKIPDIEIDEIGTEEEPQIVADRTPFVPFMLEKKRKLVSEGKLEEADKLPNYMTDASGRLYVEVLDYFDFGN